MNLQSIVADLMKELQSALRAELEAQGHKLTGNLSKSIMYEISVNGNEAVGQMFYEDYGVYINLGVSAQKVPFGSGRGRGGTSEYIQGLISFWEKRGLTGRDAVGAAFATAHVHKRDGIPSRGSYKFSSTGERTGFVRTAINDNKIKELERLFLRKYSTLLNLEFAEAFSGNQNLTVQP